MGEGWQWPSAQADHDTVHMGHFYGGGFFREGYFDEEVFGWGNK
jgi:hypothetical protein